MPFRWDTRRAYTGEYPIPLVLAIRHSAASEYEKSAGTYREKVEGKQCDPLHYMLDGQVDAWSFAAKLKGKAEPISTYFTQGDESGSRRFPHFDALVHCIEEMFVTGKPMYPVERTLLTTCTLSILFESRAWKRRIETKELAISYKAPRDIYVQRS